MQVSVVCYFKDRATVSIADNEHYFRHLCSVLESCCKDYEIIIVVPRKSVKMLRKASKMLNITSRIRMATCRGARVDDMYRRGIKEAVYEYVMLLNPRKPDYTMRYDAVFEKFVDNTVNKCFVLYEGKDCMPYHFTGVVYHKKDVCDILNLIRARSVVSFVKQLVLGYCYLGGAYRVYNEGIMLQLYPATVSIIGSEKFDLKSFKKRLRRKYKVIVDLYDIKNGIRRNSVA